MYAEISLDCVCRHKFASPYLCRLVLKTEAVHKIFGAFDILKDALPFGGSENIFETCKVSDIAEPFAAAVLANYASVITQHAACFAFRGRRRRKRPVYFTTSGLRIVLRTCLTKPSLYGVDSQVYLEPFLSPEMADIDNKLDKLVLVDGQLVAKSKCVKIIVTTSLRNFATRARLDMLVQDLPGLALLFLCLTQTTFS